MKLQKAISLNNMHGFDEHGKIKKYTRPESIIEDYFPVRLECYQKRKDLLIRQLKYDEMMSRNKARFVREIISGEMEIVKTKKSPVSEVDLERMLQDKQFNTQHEMNEILQMKIVKESKHPYNYLLEMPIHSLVEERSIAMEKAAEQSRLKLTDLQSKSIQDLWIIDLDAVVRKSIELKLI